MYLGGLKDDLLAAAARVRAAAEAERLRQVIAAEVQQLVPTAEETAEAFVAEVQKIAPPVPLEKPTVVTPPDSRLAPPAPIRTGVWRGTVPVDSRRPYYATPPPTPTTEKKPGAGIGIALAAGAAGLLAMVAGG